MGKRSLGAPLAPSNHLGSLSLLRRGKGEGGTNRANRATVFQARQRQARWAVDIKDGETDRHSCVAGSETPSSRYLASTRGRVSQAPLPTTVSLPAWWVVPVVFSWLY